MHKQNCVPYVEHQVTVLHSGVVGDISLRTTGYQFHNSVVRAVGGEGLEERARKQIRVA